MYFSKSVGSHLNQHSDRTNDVDIMELSECATFLYDTAEVKNRLQISDKLPKKQDFFLEFSRLYMTFKIGAWGKPLGKPNK